MSLTHTEMLTSGIPSGTGNDWIWDLGTVKHKFWSACNFRYICNFEKFAKIRCSEI